MNPIEFLRQLDDDAIVSAIANAERKTTGEIRVYVSSLHHENVLEAARKRFEKMGMRKTRDRNGVLIYFVPRTRKFAILGDTAIDEKAGEAAWAELAEKLSHDLKKNTATEAILNTIRAMGDLLARHFPASAETENELPNAVERS